MSALRKRKRLKINERILRKLESALEAAEMGSRCALAQPIKDGAKLYVQTWIEWPLRDAIKEITGDNDNETDQDQQ